MGLASGAVARHRSHSSNPDLRARANTHTQYDRRGFVTDHHGLYFHLTHTVCYRLRGDVICFQDRIYVETEYVTAKRITQFNVEKPNS